MPELSTAVRDHRHAKLHAVMDRQRLDAVILTTSDFFEFTTNHGLAVQGWERPFAVVLARSGRAVAVLPDIAANKVKAQQARGSVWLDDVVYYAEQPLLSGQRPLVSSWPDLLAGILSDLGLATAHIGIDAMSGLLRHVEQRQSHPRFTTVLDELRATRWVKHPEEIATMRAAASLADWALELYRQELRPGRLLQELDYAIAARTCAEAARRLPGDDFQILRFMTLSGPAGAMPHGDGAQTGARVLSDAPAVTICNVRLNGLSIEDQRTFICGHVDPAITRLTETANAATEAGLEALVVGRPVSGIDAASRTVIERAGYGAYLLHRTGHGIGVATHEFPEDMPFNERPLLDREVYVVEPGIYVPGVGGFRYVDVAVVGTVPGIITRAPRDLAAMTIG